MCDVLPSFLFRTTAVRIFLSQNVQLISYHRLRLNLFYKHIKLKLPVFVGPLSAIQRPFDILTSPGHWATLGNQRSCLPEETISLPVLCAANIRRTGISNLHRHSSLRVPNHTLVEWSLGDLFFLCPEKFTLGQCRLRTTYLSIFIRTGYTGLTRPVYVFVESPYFDLAKYAKYFNF